MHIKYKFVFTGNLRSNKSRKEYFPITHHHIKLKMWILGIEKCGFWSNLLHTTINFENVDSGNRKIT